MEHAAGPAALTVGLALAAGVLSQAIARHLRLPGIVVLLAAGVALGPDGIGLVLPEALGPALNILVGFAVAVILFEGGLNLKMSRLRRQGRAVRMLITLGSLGSLVGGTLAARFLLDWDWRPSILFGSLVIVTGPTVVTPLLRRVRVRTRLQTVLEGEGVLIDAVGAITAVVILEVALHPSFASTAAGAGGFLLRFAVGGALGLLTGFLVAFALRIDALVPEGLENIFTLSLVLAAFQIGDSIVAESGIVAVTVAGLVVGNLRTNVSRELAEFKEQLTVMLIGLLFVLLAANVRVASIVELGVPGLLTVAVLMWIVRPIGAALCTHGTELSWRERAFIGWVAPRGIVAAAVASLFAREMAREEIAGGPELVAMVFLVIAVTVTVQGLTIGPVASLLRVRRPRNVGYVIFGSNGLGLAVASCLREEGEDVVFIEGNSEKANQARAAGYAVVYGNALEERTVRRSRPDTRAGALALTANEEANFLFARQMLDRYDCPAAWVAVDRVHGHLTEDTLEDAKLGLMFGALRDIDTWSLWLDRDRASVERWRRSERDLPEPQESQHGESGPEPTAAEVEDEDVEEGPAPLQAEEEDERHLFLPLVHLRDETARPWDETVVPAPDDIVYVAIAEDARERSEKLLRDRGWDPEAEG